MTIGEISAWFSGAVLVIGAIGGQVRLYRLMTNEFQYSRKRQYALHEAVQVVGKKAEDAYQEANHSKLQITDLNQRLIEQGKLAEQASEALPQLQQTTGETKAAIDHVAEATEETKQLARDIHEKLPEP